ncbi:glycosyltransferase [Rhodohalobacter mucosus]|uniref:Glycosyl transferase n=1 Tax=Rhodohalobacter mucosus TaxID=2079485 RepID=A0A316TY87_9BACT|nr:glycosyltransferase [Rhodohalobacter mucosus]PWN07802.1 glycosyl transferase [Rhodohalobacter mucosus]
MRVVQINSALNTTSTGRITEAIGKSVLADGHESYVACKRVGPNGSSSEIIPVGNKLDVYMHGLKTRLLDRHGFGSRKATLELVGRVREIDPDVIGLHNLHGYYLNVEVLFTYLKEVQKPLVWTFHDCWPFTGHCSYFDRVDCTKWKSECRSCPMTRYYPASYGLDQSNRNFHQKKELFTGLDNMTIVTPSYWLKGLVNESFLKEYPVEVIHNGIDLETFSPGTHHLPDAIRNIDKKIILGVASVWDDRKGLSDFIKLSEMVSDDYQIVLVGLNEKQLSNLPKRVMAIAKTENVHELASIYSAAEVFVNPTYSDNFPTTNLEALACGTPVVTYDTGGSPEAVSRETGKIVPKPQVEALLDEILEVDTWDKESVKKNCRNRAEALFDKNQRFKDYLNLFKKIDEKNYKYHIKMST